MTAPPPPDRAIDASGLRCPLPVLRAGRALRGMTPGQVLAIATTDPMAVIDLPHFCGQAGHSILAQEPRDDATVWLIRCGG